MTYANGDDISWLRIVVAICISLVWAALMLIDALSTDFTAPAAVSGPMLGVVAWLFGKEFKRASNGGGK